MMPNNTFSYMTNEVPYSAVLTREQFLFYETRTTARLLVEIGNRDEVMTRIIEENLFQFPTEKTIKRMALTCFKRLDALTDENLIREIAEQPAETAKQICLYAMMKQYRIIRDFMITVIGEKYKKFDFSFGKKDLNVFFMNLQEQDENVASWSESTIKKIKQVMHKILVENNYLDSIQSDHLNPVMITSVLENAIRSAGDEIALPAFNCL